jgi:hypothetical protein
MHDANILDELDFESGAFSYSVTSLEGATS